MSTRRKVRLFGAVFALAILLALLGTKLHFRSVPLRPQSGQSEPKESGKVKTDRLADSDFLGLPALGEFPDPHSPDFVSTMKKTVAFIDKDITLTRASIKNKVTTIVLDLRELEIFTDVSFSDAYALTDTPTLRRRLRAIKPDYLTARAWGVKKVVDRTLTNLDVYDALERRLAEFSEASEQAKKLLRTRGD